MTPHMDGLKSKHAPNTFSAKPLVEHSRGFRPKSKHESVHEPITANTRNPKTAGRANTHQTRNQSRRGKHEIHCPYKGQGFSCQAAQTQKEHMTDIQAPKNLRPQPRCGRGRLDGQPCGTPVPRAGLACAAHRTAAR